MAIRPRIQRAFLAWLDDARPRLKRQIILGRRTDDILEFSFDVGALVLCGWLSRNELTVAADDGEVFWDLLIDYDGYPERSGGGVICTLCPPDKHRVFASREELWRDHLFEPFLTWVNEDLAPATALALFGSASCGTWAKLVRNPEEAAGATKVMSLETL